MATTDNILIIRNSGTTAVVPDNVVRTGEMAYSWYPSDSDGGGRLWIGAGTEVNNLAPEKHLIGGSYFVEMLDHKRGHTVPNAALITDADGKIDELKVDDMTFDGSTISDNSGTLTLVSSGNIVLQPGTGNVNVSGKQLKNIANPTEAGDAVSLAYLNVDNADIKGDDDVVSNWRYATGTLDIAGGANITTAAATVSTGNVEVTVNLDPNLTGLTSVTIDDIVIDGNVIRAIGQNLVLDPSPDGPPGTVVIQGDLQVEGTTTTINSTELTINDKLIVLGNGAPDSSSVNGGGILLDGANASLTYNASTDFWEFNKDITAPNLSVTTITGKYEGFDSDFAQKTTDDLTEGSTNLYYRTDRFDSDFGDNNTDDLAEGTTNIYYTTARFDSDFGDNNTDDLTEGSTNLYYTDTRARASVSAVDAGGDGSFSYDPITGVMTYVGPSPAEVRAHFSATGDLSYDSATGVFSIDVETEYTKANFDSDLGDANTGQLPEGSNLYYTTARFDSDFGDNTTDDLSEGSTNLYYTDERVDDRVAQLLSMAEGLDASYDDATGVLTLSTELATSTNIGGAAFDSVDFLVTAGQVEINIIDCGTY